MKTYAPSGRLSNVAKTPGPDPAQTLVTTTAPKNRTNGAPVPVTGSSSVLKPNATATAATPSAYRRTARGNALRRPDCDGCSPLFDRARIGRSLDRYHS